MVAWVDFDKLESYKKLSSMTKKVDLTEVMAGEEGAARVAEYEHGISGLSVYKCEYGDHWHLTGNSEGKNEKRDS